MGIIHKNNDCLALEQDLVEDHLNDVEMFDKRLVVEWRIRYVHLVGVVDDECDDVVHQYRRCLQQTRSLKL